MNRQNDFLLNISALYRHTQKYFDKNMAEFNLGSGQLIILLLVYENEGLSMQQVSLLADIDKGTTTKSIKKLVDEGYVDIKTDENDKRVKKLFSTDKATSIINDLYALRNEYFGQVMKEISEEDIDSQLTTMEKMAQNARAIDPDDSYSQIKFGGIQKLTLLDYPGQVASTLFTVGCNMKCPFCHNKDLVFVPENMEYIEADEILDFLNKRQGIIDAICITGGEPLLQAGLLDFLRQVKDLGYLIKIDTNGLLPDKLKELVQSGYVDYVALDVKNSLEKYCETIGLPESEVVLDAVKKSINILMKSNIDYEFRTTIVKEFHEKEDLIKVAKMIKGCKNYYLQNFVDSGRCIKEGLSSCSKEELEDMCNAVKEIIPNVQLRGI